MNQQASVGPPWWQVWSNPIVRRYATARLRLLRLAAWSLVVQPLAAFLWLVVYFSTKHTVTPAHAALNAWTPILILQGLLWLVKGTFSVAVGIAREGAEGLSDTQRLTPLGPWHKVLGYLCGLPILETVLVASLLPWTVVSVVLGHVPPTVVFRVHLLLATSAVLHHSIGLVAGTVIRQKIVAGTVSQVLVILLHFVVPLFSRFGLGPLGHLGVERAIASELLALQDVRIRTAVAQPLSRARFFDYEVTATGYAWVIMAVLGLFLLQILRRRWQRADSHLFSKPLALAFSAWIIVMTLGETFPLLRDGTLFDLGNRLVTRGTHGRNVAIGETAMSALTQGLIPVGWAGAFGGVALLSAMILAAIITPTLERHLRARRAARNGAAHRPPWTSDAASAVWWTAALGLLALAGWVALVEQLFDTPLLHLAMRPGAWLPINLGLGLMIPLLTWAILLEWRGIKAACLGAFVLWIIPVMVSVVGLLSGSTTLEGWPRWWLALSGLTLPFYSMGQSVSGIAQVGGYLQELRAPWIASLCIHAILAGGMFICLRRAQRLGAN